MILYEIFSDKADKEIYNSKLQEWFLKERAIPHPFKDFFDS